MENAQDVIRVPIHVMNAPVVLELTVFLKKNAPQNASHLVMDTNAAGMQLIHNVFKIQMVT